MRKSRKVSHRETRPMRQRDIVKIIAQCAESGVMVFHYRDLHISFKDRLTESVSHETVSEILNETSCETLFERTKLDESKDRISTHEDQLAMLMIEDPEEYERWATRSDDAISANGHSETDEPGSGS